MKLAVTLAERFSGEIINSDALQLYEGLPIASNKLPIEERKGIPHHLLDCIRLEEEPWVVSNYITEAEKILDEIRARGKIPILVGGTHYYIQSLIFQESMVENEEEDLSAKEHEERWPILGASTEVILEELRRMDPEMARKWHPRDHRKIRRSLEIWLRTGKRASEIYEAQRTRRAIFKDQPDPVSSIGSVCLSQREEHQLSNELLSMRFDVLTFWTHTDSDTLKSRLNNRVEAMIQQGLLDEIKYMKSICCSEIVGAKSIDLTKGIWIAIGYKEFAEYLTAYDEGVATENLERLLADGIEKTKAATRQYAKRQTRWIRLKLLPALQDSRNLDKLFLLDGSDLSNFSSMVEDAACEITKSFLAGCPLPEPTTLSETAAKMLNEYLATPADRVYTRFCETCGITLMTEKEWAQHSRSKKHKGLLKRVKEGESLRESWKPPVVDDLKIGLFS